MGFYNFDPTLEYKQDYSNIFCFVSLASTLNVSGEFVAMREIVGQTKASLVCQSKGYSGEVKFANNIMIDKEQDKVDHNLHMNIKRWKVKGRFDILNDNIKNITLVQLVDKVGNVNHSVSIFVHWIFDKNYKK